MKTSEIRIGILYAVGEGQRARHRGIILSLDPHRLGMSYSGSRQLWRFQPDPHGRGSGGRRASVGGERGLPVLLAIPPYRYDEHTKPELTDDELHELAQQLIADGFTGDELGEDQRIFLDRRARLEVARPQAIERLWADHLEIERRYREAREAEADRRARTRQQSRLDHQRVLDLLDRLGIQARIPVADGYDGQSIAGTMAWGSLATLLEAVVGAATEQAQAHDVEVRRAAAAQWWASVTADEPPDSRTERERQEDDNEEGVAAELYGADGPPEEITRLVEYVAASLTDDEVDRTMTEVHGEGWLARGERELNGD